MDTILSRWDRYRSRLLPINAPIIQETQCKMAFNSGAKTILILLTELASSDLSEGAVIDAIKGYHLELDDYLNQIIADYSVHNS